MHQVVRGKLHAQALIVGNNRTRRALPRGVRGEIFEVMESGVDVNYLTAKDYNSARTDGLVAFIFCSRFVDWKGIKYLVKAFAPLAREGGVRLHLVGDGELFGDIAKLIDAEGISDHVVLHGRVPSEHYMELLRRTDVYVTPSLRECGGMAMMEAMAVGLPVISLRWGGGAQYANDNCAFFIEPGSEFAVIHGLTAAMRQLARSPDQRRRMGLAARQRIIDAELSWDAKVGKIADILGKVVRDYREQHPVRTPGTADSLSQQLTVQP
jgi:glycosyltransferase involved in cell wall biosynthesis